MGHSRLGSLRYGSRRPHPLFSPNSEVGEHASPGVPGRAPRPRGAWPGRCGILPAHFFVHPTVFREGAENRARGGRAPHSHFGVRAKDLLIGEQKARVRIDLTDFTRREPPGRRRSGNGIVPGESLFENPFLGGTGHWPVPAGYQLAQFRRWVPPNWDW